jgi:hypothetical protein
MVLAGVPAGEARAGTQVDAAVEALRSTPLYNAPKAKLGLSSADRSRVERAIEQEQPGPVYIACCPTARAPRRAGTRTSSCARSPRRSGGRARTWCWPDASCAQRAPSLRPTRRADSPAMRSTPTAARAPALCSPISSTGSPRLATPTAAAAAQVGVGRFECARRPGHAGGRRRRVRLPSLAAAPARAGHADGAAAARRPRRPRELGRRGPRGRPGHRDAGSRARGPGGPGQGLVLL